jgi:ABC-type transport system substrate-binding protein
VKAEEGRIDVVSELRPLDTLRVAQSPLAKVVKNRGALLSVVGMFNVRKVKSPWVDVRQRQAANNAINRADLIRYATKGNGVIIPALIRQMERHTFEHAYLLFLYNPIELYAVNKAVAFVPYVNGQLSLAETAVTQQHWSVRKQKAAIPE